MKSRSITMAEGKYLNLFDMIRALNDDAFVKDCAAMLAVGKHRGETGIQCVRMTIAYALIHFAGEEESVATKIKEQLVNPAPVTSLELEKFCLHVTRSRDAAGTILIIASKDKRAEIVAALTDELSDTSTPKMLRKLADEIELGGGNPTGSHLQTT